MDIYATELMGAKAYDAVEITLGGSANSLLSLPKRPIVSRITCCPEGTFSRWWPSTTRLRRCGREVGAKRQRAGP